MTGTNVHQAITDPSLRRMVEVAAAEFRGTSDDGSVSATVRGDLTVLGVEVGPVPVEPGVAGQRLTQAINAALESARTSTLTGFLDIQGLDPQLRSILAGESDLAVADDVEAGVDPTVLDHDFSGADGEVLVTVSGRTQQVTSVNVPNLEDESLDRVPRATNRALTAAQLGRDGAVPLDEQADKILETLDTKMSAIEAKLDGVEDTLDALARDLDL